MLYHPQDKLSMGWESSQANLPDFWSNWAYKAKQGQSNTMPIYSNAIDRTGGPQAAAPLFCPLRPPCSVVSTILEYMGMVLDCPCLALEAQLIQKSPTKKFGRGRGTIHMHLSRQTWHKLLHHFPSGCVWNPLTKKRGKVWGIFREIGYIKNSVKSGRWYSKLC